MRQELEQDAMYRCEQEYGSCSTLPPESPLDIFAIPVIISLLLAFLIYAWKKGIAS